MSSSPERSGGRSASARYRAQSPSGQGWESRERGEVSEGEFFVESEVQDHLKGERSVRKQRGELVEEESYDGLTSVDEEFYESYGEDPFEELEGRGMTPHSPPAAVRSHLTPPWKRPDVSDDDEEEEEEVLPPRNVALEALWRDNGYSPDHDSSLDSGDEEEGEVESVGGVGIPEGTSLLPDVLIAELKMTLEDTKIMAGQADYTMRSVAEEIRHLSIRQQVYERKYVFNSVVSYIIFCGLIFGIVYFIFDSRTNDTTVDTKEYEIQSAAERERLELAEAELKKLRNAGRIASDIYRLIEQGLHEAAMERFIKSGDRILNRAEHALLREKVDSLKWKLAEDAYNKGVEYHGGGNFEKARDTFFTSIAYQAEAPYSSYLNYYLGMSLYQLRDFPGARRFLDRALKGPLSKEFSGEALYHRASATELMGERDLSYDQYSEYLTYHRYGKYASEVVSLKNKITRRQMIEKKAQERAEKERRLRDEQQ